MAERAGDVLRDQGRGIVGGLILGLPLLYTMETWWLGWTLPAWTLGLFAGLGLLVVAAVVELVGFRAEHEGRTPPRELAQDFAELVLQSVLATFLILWLFGLVGRGEPLGDAMRLGLIEIVPVALGAAVANRMLKADHEADETSFAREMAVFALGAAFFAFPVAPTEEMEMLVSQAGWTRILLIGVVSVVATYVTLYELQFRGSRGRGEALEGRHLRLAETCAGYVIALAVCVALLASYGHLDGASLAEGVQQTVMLGLLASFGGAAARVVI